MYRAFSILLSALFCISSPLVSEDTPSPISAEKKSEEIQKSPPSATWKEDCVVQRSLDTPNGPLPYSIRVGSMRLPGQDDGSFVDISCISYTVENSKEVRPITFCFNGGPGSSSVWLHIGLLGPKTLQFPSPITSQNHQAQLVDNITSLLCTSDLVFVDPAGTGISKTSQKNDPKNYYGVDEDISSLAFFMERYLTLFKRFDSQKYICGESYGTLRAVLLAQELHNTYFLDTNGLILISQALDLSILNPNPFCELSIVTSFPSITLAAYAHGLLSTDLLQQNPVELYERSKHFAQSELGPALLNTNLSPEKLSSLSQEASRLTGLPSSYIEQAHLRITLSNLEEQILSQQGFIIGRFDTRVTLSNPYHANEGSPLTDPSLSLIASSFTNAINTYFLKDLGMKIPYPYLIINPDANYSWNWKSSRSPTMNLSSSLQNVMASMPSLRLYTAIGLFDAATFPFTQEFVYSRLNIGSPAERIKTSSFIGGHMMYLDPAICRQINTELQAFTSLNTSQAHSIEHEQ